MRLPFIRKKDDVALRPAAGQDQAERMIAEGFRTMGQLLTRIADYIEGQRLRRAGYEEQGKFLERLDLPKSKDSPSK
jgi:hypothetical protein